MNPHPHTPPRIPPWPLTALAAAGLSFVAARLVAPPKLPAASHQGAMASAVTASRSSAELEAALAATATAGDALERRLRFLELIERANPIELRRMFLGGATSQREKLALAQRWAETDPASLFDFLKSLSPTEWARGGESHTAVLNILFRTWAKSDADAAMAAADALANRPQFRKARWEIVQALFETDPAKAFSAAEKLPHYGVSGSLRESLWKADPAAFLKAAGEASVQSLRNGQISVAVTSAFGELVSQNPAAAAEWLKSRPADQQRRLWAQLALKFADTDLTAAQTWFAEIPPSPEREKAGAQIVNAWAQKDPRAALEWLQDHLHGGSADAFGYVAGALAEKGIESAQQLLEVMPPGTHRDRVVVSIAEHWMEKDAKAAAQWLLTLPSDDPGRRQAFSNVGYQWAEKDLEGAAAFALESAGREEGRDLIWPVVSQYAEKDLAAGLDWASRLPKISQDDVFGYFYQSVQSSKKLPEFYTALEKLPAETQQEMASGIATNVLNTHYFDSDQDARLLNSLQQMPEKYRAAARQAIEKSSDPSYNPGRRQAALDALK